MGQHRLKPRVELVEWAEMQSPIRTIREAVFITEQGVPEALEWDGLDPLCSHALAWNSVGEPIGTARMRADGVIGRMAVLRNWRGRGIGRSLLEILLHLAVKQGLQQVTLAAQIHAVGFYERAGFHAIGAPFMDAGIPHRMMIRDLLAPRTGSERL
jgi:predicted GNAT family N-acyltransferase